MNKQRRMAIVAVLTLGSGAPASGGFTVIKGFENWSAAAGPATRLDFVFPEPVWLSDQYAGFGVTFLSNEIAHSSPASYLQDGWGVKGGQSSPGQIRMQFDEPQYAIGAWFPGNLFAKLYWQGELVYSSPGLKTFQQSYSFGGVVSALPFDEVVLWDTDGFVFVDDIYFGNAIPAPGVAPLVLTALFAGARRRRH